MQARARETRRFCAEKSCRDFQHCVASVQLKIEVRLSAREGLDEDLHRPAGTNESAEGSLGGGGGSGEKEKTWEARWYGGRTPITAAEKLVKVRLDLVIKVGDL